MKCRICDHEFETTDSRQLECGRDCARILASVNRSGYTLEQKIEAARERYADAMRLEHPFQDFCFGRRIVFR